MQLLDVIREILEDAVYGPEFFDPADAAVGILASVELTEGISWNRSQTRTVGRVMRRAAHQWHSSPRASTPRRAPRSTFRRATRHVISRPAYKPPKPKWTKKRIAKVAALASLGAVGAVGNTRDILYGYNQAKYYRKHKKFYRPQTEELQEIDDIITETVRRRRVATVGGITRWRKTGRPNPIRSMRAKRTAARFKHKRKVAMQRMMRSPKGAQLRRFRSKNMSMTARNKAPGPRMPRPRTPRTARRRRR